MLKNGQKKWKINLKKTKKGENSFISGVTENVTKRLQKYYKNITNSIDIWKKM